MPSHEDITDEDIRRTISLSPLCSREFLTNSILNQAGVYPTKRAWDDVIYRVVGVMNEPNFAMIIQQGTAARSAYTVISTVLSSVTMIDRDDEDNAAFVQPERMATTIMDALAAEGFVFLLN